MNIDIDHRLLSEQVDFLTLLATDIELGNVSLPEKYYSLEALPAEYIDGVCSLIDHLLDIVELDTDYSGIDYSGNLPKDEV